MEDEAYLPKATMNQFVKENTSKNVKSSNEVIELLLDISNEFIKNLSQQTYQICTQENKKQLTPEQALQALKQSNLELDVNKLQDELKQYLSEDHKKQKMKSKFDNMNPEEMEAEQQKLFEISRSFKVQEGQPATATVSKVSHDDIKNADEIFGKGDTNVDQEDFEIY